MCKNKVALNTNYYRKNKINRTVVHVCPFSNCNYETTGPAITLRNHIYAKHTPESERPFQCKFDDCNRGFAQKCLLQNHYKKVHGLQVNLKKNRTIQEYHINVDAEYIPTSQSTMNRYNYYKENPIIMAEDLNKYEFLPGKFLNANHIHYDAREGYIKLKTYSVDDIKKKCKKVKKLKKIKLNISL
jgi:hypothetical protein